jgi:hypothetical protein
MKIEMYKNNLCCPQSNRHIKQVSLALFNSIDSKLFYQLLYLCYHFRVYLLSSTFCLPCCCYFLWEKHTGLLLCAKSIFPFIFSQTIMQCFAICALTWVFWTELTIFLEWYRAKRGDIWSLHCTYYSGNIISIIYVAYISWILLAHRYVDIT